MRRDEGVPPYRRLRRESDTMSFRALAKKFPCGKNGTLHIRARPLANAGSAPKNPPRKERHAIYPRQPTRPQWLTVEKSPAVETKIIECDQPPIFARGGSLPRNRKGNNHTRTLINIVIGRRDNRFPFREIPTVTSFPRNDKRYRRMRRFIWIIILIKTYTRTALSLRGAQSATRQSPGREDGRLVHEYPQTPASRGSPLLFPHGGGSRRKSRFESVVKRGWVAVTDDFGNLFDRIIGTADKCRGVIEFRVAHDVGKSFSE